RAALGPLGERRTPAPSPRTPVPPYVDRPSRTTLRERSLLCRRRFGRVTNQRTAHVVPSTSPDRHAAVTFGSYTARGCGWWLRSISAFRQSIVSHQLRCHAAVLRGLLDAISAPNGWGWQCRLWRPSMRKECRHPSRARLVTAVALGASALSLASPARADTKASIACRGAIAKAFSKVANTGFKLNDTCHKTADKAMTATGACNDVSNSAFDPNGKYGAAKTKASQGISAKCLSGDPVLNNYDGKDP